jgi:hypothetical protein
MPSTRLAPLASEPAVKSRLTAYFELFAARQARPDAISQEAVDAALLQVNDVLQVAEAEYHHALHQVARTPGAAASAGSSRTAAERSTNAAEQALEEALSSYGGWDETMRARGGGLYLRPDPMAALQGALDLVRSAKR